MCVSYACPALSEAKRGCLILWDWSCGWFVSHHMWAGNETQVLRESSLQPPEGKKSKDPEIIYFPAYYVWSALVWVCECMWVERVSRSLAHPWTHVAKAVLNHLILLPVPPKCWECRHPWPMTNFMLFCCCRVYEISPCVGKTNPVIFRALVFKLRPLFQLKFLQGGRLVWI